MTKKIEVFASESLPGELEDFPDIKRGWGITKESTGGIPPMKWFNALQKRTDETINSILDEISTGDNIATLESYTDANSREFSVGDTVYIKAKGINSSLGGGFFIAKIKGDLTVDDGMVLSTLSRDIVLVRNSDIARTSYYQINNDSSDTHEIITKALRNCKIFILDNDIRFNGTSLLSSNTTIDLNGFSIFADSANVFDANNSSGVVIKNGSFISSGSYRFTTGVTKGIWIDNIKIKKGALAITFVGNYKNRNENIVVTNCVHDGRTGIGSGVMGGFFSVDYGNNILVKNNTGLGGTEFIDLNNFCVNAEICYNTVKGVYKENVFDINSSQRVSVHHNDVSISSSTASGFRPVWISSYSGPAYPGEADDYYRQSDDIDFSHNRIEVKGEFTSDYMIIVNSGSSPQEVIGDRLLKFSFNNNTFISTNSIKPATINIGLRGVYNLSYNNNDTIGCITYLQGKIIKSNGCNFRNKDDVIGNSVFIRGFSGVFGDATFINTSPKKENNSTCGVVVMEFCDSLRVSNCFIKGSEDGYAVFSGANNSKCAILDYRFSMNCEKVDGVRGSGDEALRII